MASKEYYKKHTPDKKAASRRLYEESPEKKKEAMAAYNEKYKSDINLAMRENYHGNPEKKNLKKLAMSLYYTETSSLTAVPEKTCPICEKQFCHQKDMQRHVDHSHTDEEKSFTCQICDKHLHYKVSLERHMREVHDGEKHRCEKCPAAFGRGSDLEKHIREGWHYLSYHCKQCDKKLVFKNLGGLIEHVIVKQSESEEKFYYADKNAAWRLKKSGILLTCKSQVESTQLKEGEHVLDIPRKDKVKAAKERAMKKEEIINEGLQLAYGNPEAPDVVKLEFEYKKHEDDGRRKCKWCDDRIPYSNEYCPCRNPNVNWQLLNRWQLQMANGKTAEWEIAE